MAGHRWCHCGLGIYFLASSGSSCVILPGVSRLLLLHTVNIIVLPGIFSGSLFIRVLLYILVDNYANELMRRGRLPFSPATICDVIVHVLWIGLFLDTSCFAFCNACWCVFVGGCFAFRNTPSFLADTHAATSLSLLVSS
jgi:hypothetical protein